jgi:hypothetical protein
MNTTINMKCCQVFVAAIWLIVAAPAAPAAKSSQSSFGQPSICTSSSGGAKRLTSLREFIATSFEFGVSAECGY